LTRRRGGSVCSEGAGEGGWGRERDAFAARVYARSVLGEGREEEYPREQLGDTWAASSGEEEKSGCSSRCR
jgi:hypothetical protein